MIRYLAMVLLLSPAAALPCTCADPGKDSSDKVIEAACSVDMVFIGQGIKKLPAPNHLRKIQIEPSKVFKGQVPVPVVIETSTTCDHWFSVYDEYLVFGDLGEKPNQVVTSICGPSRFTSKMSASLLQLETIEAASADLEELCGDLESAARRRRIASQDQIDREEAEAGLLRQIKEGIERGRAEYEEALETTHSAQDKGS